MSESRGAKAEDFRDLVYRHRAALYESAMKALGAFLGPKWSYRLEPLGKTGKLAVRSPLMYLVKGEYEVPLTINTRGNQLRILTRDGGTFHNLREMAAELERIVQNGRAPTHQEVSTTEASRRLEINRRRGTRKAKGSPGNAATTNDTVTIADAPSTSEPTVASPTSSSDARTPAVEPTYERPHLRAPRTGTTYLQHEFDTLLGTFNRDGINDRPLAEENSVRIRRLSVLSQVHGLFRRIQDHLSRQAGDFNNVERFSEMVHEKVGQGTIFSGDQYDAMCTLIEMLSPEVFKTNPPNILRSHLDRLLREIKVF